MQINYLIIDDFLEKPEDLRAIATSQQYPKLDIQTYFPGRNSKQRVLLDGIDQAISGILRERLRPVEGSSHGKFRIAMNDDKGKAGIHIDNAHWSGILYLTLPEYCQGGTDFFKHKRTGKEQTPLTQQELKDVGLNDFGQVWTDIINPDTLDEDKWEKVMHVPMKYNRLVLFRPWLYHNAGHSFGTTLENCRLIYPLFYHCV